MELQIINYNIYRYVIVSWGHRNDVTETSIIIELITVFEVSDCVQCVGVCCIYSRRGEVEKNSAR